MDDLVCGRRLERTEITGIREDILVMHRFSKTRAISVMTVQSRRSRGKHNPISMIESTPSNPEP
jgi:hypothetical protein